MVSISKPKLKLRFLVLALISIISASSIWYVIEAAPSPTIDRVVTPGSIGPCTWFLSMDGNVPVAEAMVGGLSVSPGNNLVGTSGQDFATFVNPLVTDGVNFCLSNQLFTLKSTWTISVSDVKIRGSGVGSTTIQVFGNNVNGIVFQPPLNQAISQEYVGGFTFYNNATGCTCSDIMF